MLPQKSIFHKKYKYKSKNIKYFYQNKNPAKLAGFQNSEII